MTWDDWMRELEEEAVSEGPSAERELKAFREYFSALREIGASDRVMDAAINGFENARVK